MTTPSASDLTRLTRRESDPMSQIRLLIVHPDASTRGLMASMLRSLGHRIDEAEHERMAVRQLDHHPVDLVLVDCDPSEPGVEFAPTAIEFLSLVRRKYPQTRVLLVGSQQQADRPREAMVRGASAVLRYPMPANQLRAAVAQALEDGPARPDSAASNAATGGFSAEGRPASPAPGVSRPEAAAELRPVLGPNGHPEALPPGPASVVASFLDSDEFLGDDPTLRQALELAQVIAPTRAPVLIQGERGTGKSGLARRLHRLSPRAAGPFVEVGCQPLTEVALEAELFGRRGLAPGEVDRPGKVAQADGGTLFIDEVAVLSPPLQYRLLRLIRTGEYEPVGSIHTERSDCRVVVGSREDLAGLVEAEQFRSDLFYALGVVSLKLPPLRHRGQDVIRLAETFRDRFAREVGRSVLRFSPQAQEQLLAYEWPGNLLELKSVVERAVIYCRSHLIEPAHLALNGQEAGPSHSSPGLARPGSRRPAARAGIQPLKEALEGPERQLILEALQALNWNRQETARVLDINRTTLYKKMKKYGLLYDEPIWAN